MNLDNRDITDLLEILDWAKPKSQSNHITDLIHRTQMRLRALQSRQLCDNCGELATNQIASTHGGAVIVKNFCRACYDKLEESK